MAVKKTTASPTDEIIDETTSVIENADRRYGTQSYGAMLAGDIDVVEGADLLDKQVLVGVPHMIVNIAFRTSDVSDKEYVTIEAVTANDEQVVYNDGSTGIRRQVMNYCIGKGWATPHRPEADELVDAAKQTEIVFDYGDLPITLFEWSSPAVVSFDKQGNPVVQIPARLHAKRGLRGSEYDWTDENGKKRKATTYYFG